MVPPELVEFYQESPEKAFYLTAMAFAGAAGYLYSSRNLHQLQKKKGRGEFGDNRPEAEEKFKELTGEILGELEENTEEFELSEDELEEAKDQALEKTKESVNPALNRYRKLEEYEISGHSLGDAYLKWRDLYGVLNLLDDEHSLRTGMLEREIE